MLIQEQNISAAFSAQSVVFDEVDENNPIIQWMRGRIREHVLMFWKTSDSILELNAGTGIDAIYFAQKGFRIHATDNALGMLDVLNQKIVQQSIGNNITTQQCSFLELEKIQQTGFNHIFSNFGGLNCTDRLDEVLRSFDRLIKPGGTVTLVLMPKICPWELVLALKGNFKVAFRRLKKKGAPTYLEGQYFTTYYYSPSAVRKMFDKDYSLISIKGLGIAVPPPYLESFPTKNPRIYKKLLSLENVVADIPLFRSWADHFIISVRKNG